MSKKNSRGFTLVELLAAIVILGILMALGLPTIFSMLETNRNKLYVDAAKRMISQAEYKIRSNSTKIEQPDQNNVIVISLTYLDSSDFDTSPNDGSYIKDASFVVVKKTASGLEYSATIVEKMKKGGYKGIKLKTNNDLLSKKADKFVTIMEKSDIVYVESENSGSGSVLELGYIKKNLGDSYCNEIEAVYNLPDLAESTTSKRDNPPVIKSATLSSRSLKNFNSFDAILRITATDDITSKKDLKVYTSLKSYQDALNKTPSNYGSGDTFVMNFDFDKVHPVYDGYKITLYVVVKDEFGNEAKKELIYVLHSSKPPVINTDTDKTYVRKRNSDQYNLPTASLKLTVTDDTDATNNLMVCLKSSEHKDVFPNCSDSDYQKYPNYFGNGNTMNYNFNVPMNGQTVYLRVSVKDSSGLISSHELSYKVHKKEPPVITGVSVESANVGFTNSSKASSIGGALKTTVKVNATDVMAMNAYTVTLSSPGSSDVTYRYGNGAVAQEFVFGGKYDGNDRHLKVTVADTSGLSSSKEVVYKVYRDSNPTINDFEVVADENVCSGQSFCDGSVKTSLTLNATDDIDSDNDLRVCVYDGASNKSRCDNDGNFTSYSSNFKNKQFKYTLMSANSSRPYDGSTKDVCVVVKDKSNLTSSKCFNYKLYKNKAPDNIDASVTSKPFEINNYDASKFAGISFDRENVNLNRASITLSATDDLNSSVMKVDICRNNGSGDVCTGYQDYRTSYDLNFNDNKYTGQKYNITIKVKDEYDAVSEVKLDYTFFKDIKPFLADFRFRSVTDDSDDVVIDGIDDNIEEGDDDGEVPTDPFEATFNSKELVFNYTVLDPLDTYSICIGSANTYSECIKDGNKIYVEENIDGNNTSEVVKNIDTNWAYDGTKRKIYLVVKDSYGNEVASEDREYEVYKNCTYEDVNSIVPSVPTPSTIYDGKPLEITASSCNSKCYLTPITDKGDNNLRALYKQKISYKDRFLGSDCSSENDVIFNCSYYLCFQKEDNKSEYYKAVGNTALDTSEWSHEVEVEVEDCSGENGECVKKMETVTHTHNKAYFYYNVSYTNGKLQLIRVEDNYICPDSFKEEDYKANNGYVLIDNS